MDEGKIYLCGGIPVCNQAADCVLQAKKKMAMSYIRRVLTKEYGKKIRV